MLKRFFGLFKCFLVLDKVFYVPKKYKKIPKSVFFGSGKVANSPTKSFLMRKKPYFIFEIGLDKLQKCFYTLKMGLNASVWQPDLILFCSKPKICGLVLASGYMELDWVAWDLPAPSGGKYLPH